MTTIAPRPSRSLLLAFTVAAALLSPAAHADEAEQRILAVLDDLDRNQRAGNMNVPVEDGRLLRVLAEAIGARHVVEIGTSNGYSGLWLCLALRRTGGRLTTYEIDAGRAALARKNFQRAGVADRVTLIEGDAHVEVTKLRGPVDLVFIDADKPGYVDYLAKLKPRVRKGGLIVAHNMHAPPPDPAFVRAITTDPELATTFVNMNAAGVSISVKTR
jgi:caffeoyl-CoA O-methyltransferase